MRTLTRFAGISRGFADLAVERGDAVERVAAVGRNGGKPW